ncbi:MAG: lipopolysaccharide kinase InaA family protein [Desulfomonile sp.]
MGPKPNLSLDGATDFQTCREGCQIQIHPQARSILNSDWEMLVDFMLASIQEHQRLIAGGSVGAVLKNAPESGVTLVSIDGFPTVCVKEIRWRGYPHAVKGLIRPTQGCRTFVNGHKLNYYNVYAANPLALIRKVKRGLVRTEWVVMQSVSNALELDRYIVRRVSGAWSIEEKKGLIRSLGRFIGQMHSKGIFHSDLKTCNILVSDDALDLLPRDEPDYLTPFHSSRRVRFILVDYDEVSFSSEVSTRRKIKNLAQIFLSTPLAITMADRLRFLNEYALYSEIGGKQRRSLAQGVLEAVRGKDILYVGLGGDVIEKWYPQLR